MSRLKIINYTCDITHCSKFESLRGFCRECLLGLMVFDPDCKYCSGSGLARPLFNPGTHDGRDICSCGKMKGGSDE